MRKNKGSWVQNSRKGPGTLFLKDGTRIKQDWDEMQDANYSLKEPSKYLDEGVKTEPEL